MSKPEIGVVITTINEGDVLDGYCAQADAEGYGGQVKFFVIPDRNTPAALYEKRSELVAQGFNVVCPDLTEQDIFLSRLGIADLIPYNSDNRRNVGYLMALAWGCDVLVSLDDDNYCIPGESVFRDFASVAEEQITLPSVNSSSGWYNICEMLETEPKYPVYPRGFPYNQRQKNIEVDIAEETGIVRMNAGLWLGDPDLDAITWLAAPVQAVRFNGQPILLGKDTWSPINTQNTSLHRDLIAAYYFLRMNYPVDGFTIERYGDIFSGYFSQACVRHMEHRIRVGTPVANHDRNAHNYLHDLTQEIACIMLLEDFMEWLPELQLEGSTYEETYLSLAEAIDDQVERFRGSIWTHAARGYFHATTYHMRRWVQACRMLG